MLKFPANIQFQFKGKILPNHKFLRNILTSLLFISLLLLIFTTSCNGKNTTLPPTSIVHSTKPLQPTVIQPTDIQSQPTAIQSTITSIPPTQPGLIQTPEAPGTPAPTPFTALRNPYAVAYVPKGEVLNIRKPAGANNPEIGHFAADSHNIILTGKTTLINDQLWVEVPMPADNTTGWVNAKYLTEYVSANDFCADQKVKGLLDNFKLALTKNNGVLLSAIVSPIHGLDLRYFHNGNLANYNRAEAKFVFESTYVMDWGSHPASGEKIKGTFHEIVLPQLNDVLGSDYTLGCNDLTLGGHSYYFQWPSEYKNINFYALYKPGSTQYSGLDWRTWLVGVEYVNSEPYLVSLIHLFWEP